MARLYDLTDAETVNVWDNVIDREITARDPLLSESGLSGSSIDYLVRNIDDLSRGAGGVVTMKMSYKLTGRGRGNDEVLDGHEETYRTATTNITVDVLRHAFKVDSPMTSQYVRDDVMDEGSAYLAEWAQERMSMGLHAHAAGISIITDPVYRLHNTITAVNSSYIIRPNNKTAGNLTSGDLFDVDLLNKASQFVKTVNPRLRPAKTPWGQRFIVFLHPDQVADLKADNSLWYAQMQASLQGGRIDDNPIFTQALGQQNGFLLMESSYVPPGMNSGGTKLKANTRRAWIGGAGSLALAFGRGDRAPGFAKNRWQWTKDSKDYGFSNGIAAMTICGAKRLSYTKPGEASAREAGVVVIETYAEHALTDSDEAYAEWIRAGCEVEA